MEDIDLSNTVKSISRVILTSRQKMIMENDLITLAGEQDFNTVISLVYENLKNLGFDLVKTKFLEHTYYILTTEGISDDLTSSQYGVLSLILALSKELDDNLRIEDLKSIVSDMWESDVEKLIQLDYIRKLDIEGYEVIRLTPLGKAVMKNVINDLKLDSLLNILEEK